MVNKFFKLWSYNFIIIIYIGLLLLGFFIIRIFFIVWVAQEWIIILGVFKYSIRLVILVIKVLCGICKIKYIFKYRK